MATSVGKQGRLYGFGATERTDLWWIPTALTAIGLGIFVVYATFRAFYNAEYVISGADTAYLLSPFYSPLLIWDGMPSWLSPAFLILWAPGGFRATCYYYRKAYYRAFFVDPPGCAVGEPRNSYSGETKLLILQNIHRYFLYFALIFIVILTADFILACMWPDGFGMSVGTLVLGLNVVLLSMYTFGCHSLRHLVGGKLNCYSCVLGQTRHKLWKGVSVLNSKHMLFAWLSLFMVGFADLYIWLVASGTITDVRIF